MLYEKFKEHVGHAIEIVTYGSDDDDWNCSIECVTCHVVIISANDDE